MKCRENVAQPSPLLLTTLQLPGFISVFIVIGHLAGNPIFFASLKPVVDFSYSSS